MSVAVVIAASNLMPGLRERLAGEGELFTFADTEPIQALQAILERRPTADRPRAAVRGDAARRGADQPHQDRSAAGARRSPGDVAHRRLHEAGVAAGARRSGRADRSGGLSSATTRALCRWPLRPQQPTAPTARLARHAARAALPGAGGRRDSAGWQSRDGRGRVDRRRAGASPRRSCGRIRRCASASRTTTS